MNTIAVIGAGNVGKTLGNGLKAAGYSVQWGVREPDDPKYEGMDVADIYTAATGSSLVILAVPWSTAESTVKLAGGLGNKVVIDCINPVSDDFSGLVNLQGKSAGELIASWAPDAKVVKAFNMIGSNIMANPKFGAAKASLLIAGDDKDAKKQATELGEKLGFDVIDAGPLTMAHYLEGMAWIWIDLAMKQNQGRDIAFHLMRR